MRESPADSLYISLAPQQSLAQEQDGGDLSPTIKLMQQNARLVVITLEV